ncbi:MmcQ/YjbR family DNA-binding protein [Arcticibacterium luteifluviistationis]|uniref:MmcQ-like protein n=1 Tax=Arcticibacterium luteifluviistationis TaxID=1784714 RepID=A0A2Z4G7J9_9BACT|nr:MmcQ/YjbR family DNA-binding protein [Arcticibacterium luteifluviistationis]AWV97080.1 MmcQ-like protein [Arcticibacterium luteifluviistationis]
MDLESFRAYCLSKKGVTEELPFGPDALVFKVMGKMFALTPLDTIDMRVSLKNTPEKNLELRGDHPGIQGAFHMNKKHWSMFMMNEGVPSKVLIECTDNSYDLVVAGLTKKVKAELEGL